MKAKPLLKDALMERFRALLQIKRRVFVLRAFVDELSRVSRSKPFRIRNDIVWNMVLDYRDKCVIDLYSLSVEMRHGEKPEPRDPRVRGNPGQIKKRGLFALIRDEYTATFCRTYLPQPDDDAEEVALHTKQHAATFAALFPACTADSPTPADIEDLCEAFRLRMAPLGTDRNKNRAHALEGDAGKAKMLSVDELEALFGFCEDLLEQLSELSDSASYGRPDLNVASTPDTAADLVDLVLFGNTVDVTRLFATRGREAAFARLHALADRRPHDDNDYFNLGHFDADFVDDGEP